MTSVTNSFSPSWTCGATRSTRAARWGLRSTRAWLRSSSPRALEVAAAKPTSARTVSGCSPTSTGAAPSSESSPPPFFRLAPQQVETKGPLVGHTPGGYAPLLGHCRAGAGSHGQSRRCPLALTANVLAPESHLLGSWPCPPARYGKKLERRTTQARAETCSCSAQGYFCNKVPGRDGGGSTPH